MNFDGFEELIAAASAWGVRALGGLALIILGFLVARLVWRATHHTLRRLRLESQLVNALSSVVYYMSLAVVLIAAFGVMGIETASLITILGTCSLAIGLALQGSLSNFAAGVMLLTFRPFRKGDFIETGDYRGRVQEVGVFSTKIDTLRNIHVVVPNTYIAERPIENWTKNGVCTVDLDLEVAIDSDLPLVTQTIEKALSEEARVLDEPAPLIGIGNFGDTSAQYTIRPWCQADDYWALKFDLPLKIKTAIEAVGSGMPTPKRDLVVVSNGHADTHPAP